MPGFNPARRLNQIVNPRKTKGLICGPTWATVRLCPTRSSPGAARLIESGTRSSLRIPYAGFQPGSPLEPNCKPPKDQGPDLRSDMGDGQIMSDAIRSWRGACLIRERGVHSESRIPGLNPVGALTQ